MIWPFKKKKVVSQKKPPQAPRVAVHMVNGPTIVHYARSRTIGSDGSLTLSDQLNGKGIIATYAPGVWHSVTMGPRKVTNYVA